MRHEANHVSVIIPVYNGGQWIQDCMQSIMRQDVLSTTRVEVCVYDDGSTDNTPDLLKHFQEQLNSIDNLSMVLVRGSNPPKGVGFGKNRAVEASNGEWLCFQDIDDVMMPQRIGMQLEAARANPNAIIGSKFVREPANSTERFTRWGNWLAHNLLTVQVLTSHGPTVIMPTWFCTRQVFDRVGGFSEAGAGTPEDLIFFYRHLDVGGDVIRVELPLLVYRYHPQATTLSISEDTIWQHRIKRLEEKVLPQWSSFTIWNAGKQGRKLYRSLSPANQDKVREMCDVDEQKIGKVYQPYSPADRFSTKAIPIKNFRNCCPPFVICVKLDMTGGDFERNLSELMLEEGTDYVLFS